MEDQGPAVKPRLHKADLNPDPLKQFELWFAEATQKAQQPNPNAMVLCTLSPDGWPEGRPVLLKQVDAAGFVFYTNLQSDKGQSLKALPKAELVFHWDHAGRQVRIRGQINQVSPAEADTYFASRPRESQLGAWASAQSQAAVSLDELMNKFHNAEQKYEGQPVPRPPHWSGFRLTPSRYEFWQADPFRFHDRFRYYFEATGWKLSRVNP